MAKKKIVLRKKGKKTIVANKGGLHKSLGVPQNQPIPAGMMHEAMMGKYGMMAQKQARFKANVLTGRKKKKGKK